jgi:hypothetical protein
MLGACEVSLYIDRPGLGEGSSTLQCPTYLDRPRNMTVVMEFQFSMSLGSPSRRLGCLFEKLVRCPDLVDAQEVSIVNTTIGLTL